MMMATMARLSGGKGAAYRNHGKENEQTTANHLQKKNPKRTNRWGYCALSSKRTVL